MFLCLVFLLLLCLFIAALWSLLGKDFLALVDNVMYFCFFPMWYPRSGVVLD